MAPKYEHLTQWAQDLALHSAGADQGQKKEKPVQIDKLVHSFILFSVIIENPVKVKLVVKVQGGSTTEKGQTQEERGHYSNRWTQRDYMVQDGFVT